MSDKFSRGVQDVYKEFLASRECSVFSVAFLWIKKAQEKFPVFARDEFHAVSLLAEEVGEVAKALNDAHDKPVDLFHHTTRAQDELLDVITVAVRLYLMLEKKGGGSE